MLLNMEMSATSPPFGLTLFVIKGVAPPDTTTGDVFRAALPFLGYDSVVMAKRARKNGNRNSVLDRSSAGR